MPQKGLYITRFPRHSTANPNCLAFPNTYKLAPTPTCLTMETKKYFTRKKKGTNFIICRPVWTRPSQLITINEASLLTKVYTALERNSVTQVDGEESKTIQHPLYFQYCTYTLQPSNIIYLAAVQYILLLYNLLWAKKNHSDIYCLTSQSECFIVLKLWCLSAAFLSIGRSSSLGVYWKLIFLMQLKRNIRKIILAFLRPM